MSDSIHREKLFQDVADRMIEHIRSQQWAVGMKLPSEPELAKLFDVSRSTIRSAVKSLQLSGVLRSRAGSGTYVAQSAPVALETRELASVLAEAGNLQELVQARYILEPQLAALAARNAAPEEKEALFEILQDMEQNLDRSSLMANGYRFHHAVAAMAHNRVLYGFYQSVACQLRGLRVLDGLTLEVFLEGIVHHRAVADAIRAGDSILARQRMRKHLEKSYAPYLEQPEILE